MGKLEYDDSGKMPEFCPRCSTKLPKILYRESWAPFEVPTVLLVCVCTRFQCIVMATPVDE